jgi:predicted GH43/DUF377 family glycosyl hydrolase
MGYAVATFCFYNSYTFFIQLDHLAMMAQQLFRRCERNPILTTADLPFPALGVLNPGALEVDGHVVLLLRVENLDGYSDIYVARSLNGITNWQIDPCPILKHGLKAWRYEAWGCEDARATWMPDDECWYLTYVAYSPLGPAVALARTRDFTHAERISLLGATNDKDGVLFPRKFNGHYAILHRPDAGGHEHIWSAYSPDLVHWGEPHCVLAEGFGPAWDAVKVGAGPPPIPTDHGWLLIYHGVKRYAEKMLYRVGLALLDLNKPHQVLARTPGCVFQPEMPYELSGTVPHIVFPTGTLLRGDELWMYYGAADSCVCLATARLDDLLAYLA